MSKTKHNYSKNIKFDGEIAKEQFDALLDQVLIISKSEYEEESSDEFQDFVKYWNGVGVRRFNQKLIANGQKIEASK